MDATTVAIDLAKNVFQVAISDAGGQVSARRRLSRRQFAAFVETLQPGTTVVMETCGTAHYWGRRCRARGADVRLLPAQYVRAYVRRDKTDRTDTDALLEAHRCRGIQAVPIKTVDQQTLQALHRVRQQWQSTRTGRINLLRGLLREHGLAFPVGARIVQQRIAALLHEPDSEVPPLLRATTAAVLEEIRMLTQQIAMIDRQLTQLARTLPAAGRLQQIPGVGIITATALIGSVPHIHAFRRGRHFASWLGLTPRESSSGERRTLGHISKRGDTYLRTLLVHGARSALRIAELRARQNPATVSRLQQWAVETVARRGRNRSAVALANKLARIIWAVWTRDVDFVSPLAA
jgi:transposase